MQVRMEEGYVHQMAIKHQRDTVDASKIPMPAVPTEGGDSNPYLPADKIDKLFVNRLSKRRDRLQTIADLNEQSNDLY